MVMVREPRSSHWHRFRSRCSAGAVVLQLHAYNGLPVCKFMNYFLIRLLPVGRSRIMQHAKHRPSSAARTTPLAPCMPQERCAV